MKTDLSKKITYIIVLSLLCMCNSTYFIYAKSEELQSSKYCTDGYEVSITVTDSWSDSFNANVVITNTGMEDIDNWSLAFKMPYKIMNIWNGSVESN